MITFKNKDDVITALIHLGYLVYHQKAQTAFISNEEIRTEFAEALEENKWNEFIDFQKRSEKLLILHWTCNNTLHHWKNFLYSMKNDIGG